MIAVPTKNTLRDVQGILVAEVNLKFMWDLVGAIKVGNSGVAYVVDRNGELVAFRDTSRVLAKENLLYINEVEEFTKSTSTKPEEEIEIKKGILGTMVVSSYAPLGIPDWAVIVESPITEAYAPIIRMVLLSLLIVLIVSLLMIIAGRYLSEKITRPLRDLQNAVSQISSGNLDAQIETNSNNEIGQLAVAFNKMSSELQSYYKVLEEKVKERTKTLDEKIEELKQMNSLMVDRELRMIELKKQIAELKEESTEKERTAS